MKTVLQCAMLVVGILIGNLLADAWGWSIRGLFSSATTTPAETTKATGEVQDRIRELRVLGRLTPTEGIIHVGARPGDRLKTLDVAEGEEVEADQQIGTLESATLKSIELDVARLKYEQAESLRKAELAAAEARLGAAAKALEQARAANPQIDQQKGQVALAAENLKLAEADLERLNSLRSDLVTDQEREQLELLVEKARLEHQAARATLDQLQQATDFQLETAQADYDVARAGLDQVDSLRQLKPLEAELELAEYQLQQTTLKAPVAGRILMIHTRPGESITPEPILQMADTRRMSCIAEVHESAVPLVSVGQKVRIESDAFESDRVTGVIAVVGSQVDPPQLRSLDPLAPQNRHAVEVRVDLDADSSRVVADLIDLQVDVVILLDE